MCGEIYPPHHGLAHTFSRSPISLVASEIHIAPQRKIHAVIFNIRSIKSHTRWQCGVYRYLLVRCISEPVSPVYLEQHRMHLLRIVRYALIFHVSQDLWDSGSVLNENKWYIPICGMWCATWNFEKPARDIQWATESEYSLLIGYTLWI